MGDPGYENPAFSPEKGENGVPPPSVNPIPDSQTKNGMQVADEQAAHRSREPLWLCKILANYPKSVFGVTLTMHIFMFLVTFGLLRSGYDILPIEFDELPLDIRDDVDYLRMLAWKQRENGDIGLITREKKSVSLSDGERSSGVDGVQLSFRLEGGNVFTKRNLELIRDVENDFFNDEQYKNDMCLLVNGVCSKPNSILRFFDGSMARINPKFNDPEFDNIVEVITLANTLNSTKQMVKAFLSRDAVIDGTVAESFITRSTLYIGFPLEGYTDPEDASGEQEKKAKQFLLNTVMVKGDKYFDQGVGDMEFCYGSFYFIFLFITKQVFMDMALAIGSLVFIITFICIQTGSLWVGLFSVFSIIASFVSANIVYRCILDFRYFGIFHVLAVFIILGIGADDVFVFYDNWKETGHHEYPSVAHRLSDCYRKASIAMLFTSLTTAIAFICSASSPFLGISSFGVFAGILVTVNYISVIIFFPAVVVTYHYYWEKYKCCCCCPRKGMEHDIGDREVPPPDMPVKRKNFIVRFFRGPYYNIVTHKIIRWVILVVIGCILGVFISYATKLKVNDEDTKFLPDDSNMGKYLAWRLDFSTEGGGSGLTTIYLAWGLKNQDLSSCHKTDASCVGETVWDEQFNLETSESQTALMGLCNDIRSLDDETIDKLRIKRSIFDQRPEVDCFLTTMKTFYEGQTEGAVPFLEASAKNVMAANTDIYTPSIPSGYDQWFTVGMSYWLYNGFAPITDNDPMRMYGDLLGEALYENFTQTVSLPANRGGGDYSYGTRLRFAAIRVNTTMQQATLGYQEGLPVRDAWEEWASEKIAQLPDPLKGGFQTAITFSGSAWHSLKVQEKLVSSAVMGIVVGLCCALPILIIATHNIITGLLATFSICCVITCVIGVIPLAGWKLGMLESLNLVLVVGLSVDYVVHLAEGYSRSLHTDRSGRLRDMLEEVGISVISGAFTTLGASFFLIFAEILFFFQFGLFMFATIGLSLLFSLVSFTTLMGIIGPQGDTGSLKPLYKAIAKCVKRE